MRFSAAPVLLLLAAGCGRDAPTRSETPEAAFSASPLHFLPGEPSVVKLTVTAPGSVQLPPDAAAKAFGGLTVLSGPEKSETELAAGWKRTVMTWRVTGYLPGPATVGPLAVSAGGANVYAGSLALTVDDPLEGASGGLEELRGEKGPLDVPLRALKMLIAVGVGVLAVVAAAAAAAVVLAMKRRARRGRAGEEQPSVYERALAALEMLRETLAAITDFKPLYYDMNMMLRRFIEEEFGFAASRETTEEFLVNARGGLPEALRGGLDDYFARCDLVKYAGAPVDRNAAAAALDTAVDFVKKARSVHAPAGRGSGDGAA
ncbi:MAG TPA: hypothetical protein ENN09_04870 [Planctomycetes bacterium]|nr:hypothetical protein [Planctomycetota bacterium]